MAYVTQKINESDIFTIDRADSGKSDQKQNFLLPYYRSVNMEKIKTRK